MTTDRHSPSLRPPAFREIAILSLACLAYSVLSFLAKAPKSVAIAHAHDVAAFESRFGLFIEGSANAWLSAHPLLASAASAQYAVSFLAMTGFALVVLWRKAPTHYRNARWILVIMTIGALITYWTYPLAPVSFPSSALSMRSPSTRPHIRSSLARLRTPTEPCPRCTWVGPYGLHSCLARTCGARGGRD